MKNVLIQALGLSIAVCSYSAFAEKMIIKGEPLVLEKQGELYIVPETYKVQEYQYVTIDGKQRACFLDKKPDFVNIDVVTINVQTGTEKTTWNCYSLDPSIFTIQK